MLAVIGTRHIFSHSERGQGGPRDESAGRFGEVGAAEARGLGDTQEGCKFQSFLWSNGFHPSPYPCPPSSPPRRDEGPPPEGRLSVKVYKFPRLVGWFWPSFLFLSHLFELPR